MKTSRDIFKGLIHFYRYIIINIYLFIFLFIIIYLLLLQSLCYGLLYFLYSIAISVLQVISVSYYSACQHKLPKIDFPITFEVLNLQDKEYYIWNLHKIIFVVIIFSGLKVKSIF